MSGLITTELPDFIKSSGPVMARLEASPENNVMVFFRQGKFETVIKHAGGYIYLNGKAMDSIVHVYADAVQRVAHVLISGQEVTQENIAEPELTRNMKMN